MGEDKGVLSELLLEDRYTATEFDVTQGAILRTLPDLVFRLNHDGVHLDFYALGIEELYAQPDKTRGKKVTELLPRDVADTYMLFIRKTLESASLQIFEYELDFAESGRRYYEARMVPCWQNSVLTLVRNITERKRLEVELAAKADRLEMAMAVLEDGIYDWDIKDGKVFFDARFYTMAGYDPYEFACTVHEWKKRVHPDDLKRIESTVRAYMAGVTRKCDEEYRFKTKDAKWIWVRARIKIVNRNEQGDPVRMVGIHSDITDRKKLELQLATINQVVENSLNAFHIINEFGSFMYVNRAYIQMWGYDSADEIIGTSTTDHFVEPGILDRIISQLKREGQCVLELEAKRKDGSSFDILMCARLDHDYEGREIYPTTSIDITAKKKAEAQSLKLMEKSYHSQKLEAIGRLAGEVAHDFNNLLGVILGYAEMGQSEPGLSPKLCDYFQQIVKAAERSKNITWQLLAFAKKQPRKAQILYMNNCIEEDLSLLRRLMGKDISLNWMPEPGLWPVQIDPSQLDQILLNLTINAREAIEGTGEVTIATSNIRLNGTLFNSQDRLVYGDYILLSVSDTGCGISEQVIAKLFEPFFSTKSLHTSSGLGLATVYGIVQQVNGHIEVESELGKGSSFRIYLPRSNDSVQQFEGDSPAPDFVAAPHEAVLLVEDEAALLKMSKAMLESMGLKVLVASSAADALQLIEDYDGDIHLLIANVVMQDMSGKELAGRLKMRYPSLKILFMSGSAGNTVDEYGILDEGFEFIEKPFFMHNLTAKLAKILR